MVNAARGALLLSVIIAAGATPALAAGAPTIAEESALAGPNTAIVRAKIDPAGGATTCHLEYVSEAEYEATGYAEAKTVPCTPESLSAGTEEMNVIVEIAGLAFDTAYRFRFEAQSGEGIALGAGASFETFGIESFEAGLHDAGGEPFTQAGGHPYEYTTAIALNHGTERASPSGNLESVEVELPPGLVGDPEATPRCAVLQAEAKQCPGEDQVGTIEVGYGSEGGRESSIPAPLFNVVPPEGVVAELSARFNGFANAFIDAHVRTGGDYGIDADSLRITSLVDVRRVAITIWGVPDSEAHDSERVCVDPPAEGSGYQEPCETITPPAHAATPFLTAPTSCTGAPLTERALADAYQAPEEWAEASASLAALTGCGVLSFDPSIEVAPEATSTDSPTGLRLALNVPQDESAEDLATANLKAATVELPVGLTVNPAAASGLVGCPLLSGSEAHAGQVGIDLENAEAATCPDESKVGSAELETPLIGHVLRGSVFLAQQGDAGPAHGSNPFDSLLALYLAIEDPETGVIVKLAGRVEADPATGRLTARFDEDPQLPFESLKFDLYGGQRTLLATPAQCGRYEATSLLEPWSHEAPGEEGTPDAAPISAFAIASLPGGAPCAAPPFAPTLTAGTSDNEAGAYSSFTTLVERKDGEQPLKSVAVTLPPGVAGDLAAVPRCEEPAAEEGACPADSRIGSVSAQAGVGSEPLALPEAGHREDPIYLTGPYEGAPFGLAILVHPEAGPYDLQEAGEPIVVRAKVQIDEHTGQLSIATPADGPRSLPTILQGIPLHLRSVYVDVNRPGFMFNATSCEPMPVEGTVGSSEGARADVSSRYQAAGCAQLPFAPKLSASTRARHSRKRGASLSVKIAYPQAGEEANIHEVRVTMPHILPARLDTLKGACTEAQFTADPAGCPAASVVGSALARTPMLPVPLAGPAIFVSHGGAEFPNLDFVLQGDGVSIVLTGDTFISRKGVTSSTFATVPDLPASEFTLTLPEGPHSALAASGDLCGRPLYMPTSIVGHNEATTHQRTRIAVRGCKPRIEVLGHAVRGPTAAIRLRLPSAGRLVARGHGISPVHERVGRKRTVVVEVRLGKRVRRLLTRRPRRHLRIVVHVSLLPRRGKTLTVRVPVLLR